MSVIQHLLLILVEAMGQSTTRHFDERLAAVLILDTACARGEISHGYTIYHL
jgi:hypothetical protein